MTPKQQKASLRNWAKLRILGITTNISILSKEEVIEWNIIKASLDKLRANWDKNTEIVLDIKLKPYKCDFCGRRSNVKYEMDAEILGNSILCKKHYESFSLD